MSMTYIGMAPNEPMNCDAYGNDNPHTDPQDTELAATSKNTSELTSDVEMTPVDSFAGPSEESQSNTNLVAIRTNSSDRTLDVKMTSNDSFAGPLQESEDLVARKTNSSDRTLDVEMTSTDSSARPLQEAEDLVVTRTNSSDRTLDVEITFNNSPAGLSQETHELAATRKELPERALDVEMTSRDFLAGTFQESEDLAATRINSPDRALDVRMIFRNLYARLVQEAEDLTATRKDSSARALHIEMTSKDSSTGPFQESENLVATRTNSSDSELDVEMSPKKFVAGPFQESETARTNLSDRTLDVEITSDDSPAGPSQENRNLAAARTNLSDRILDIEITSDDSPAGPSQENRNLAYTRTNLSDRALDVKIASNDSPAGPSQVNRSNAIKKPAPRNAQYILYDNASVTKTKKKSYRRSHLTNLEYVQDDDDEYDSDYKGASSDIESVESYISHDAHVYACSSVESLHLPDNDVCKELKKTEGEPYPKPPQKAHRYPVRRSANAVRKKIRYCGNSDSNSDNCLIPKKELSTERIQTLSNTKPCPAPKSKRAAPKTKRSSLRDKKVSAQDSKKRKTANKPSSLKSADKEQPKASSHIEATDNCPTCGNVNEFLIAQSSINLSIDSSNQNDSRIRPEHSSPLENAHEEQPNLASLIEATVKCLTCGNVKAVSIQQSSMNHQSSMKQSGSGKRSEHSYPLENTHEEQPSVASLIEATLKCLTCGNIKEVSIQQPTMNRSIYSLKGRGRVRRSGQSINIKRTPITRSRKLSGGAVKACVQEAKRQKLTRNETEHLLESQYDTVIEENNEHQAIEVYNPELSIALPNALLEEEGLARNSTICNETNSLRNQTVKVMIIPDDLPPDDGPKIQYLNSDGPMIKYSSYVAPHANQMDIEDIDDIF